jgi:hypothetical protein
MDDNEERAKRVTFSTNNPKKDVCREVDLRTKQRMSADSKLSYGDAMLATFRADEDLHRLYLDKIMPAQARTI